MAMNKRGSTTFMVGIMLAVMLFIGVVVMIEPIKDVTTWARSASQMDCDGGGLSTGEEMTCIVLDSYLPIYIGIGLAVALGVIGVSKTG